MTAELLERFTFADIAMAQVVVAIEPPDRGLLAGRASRRPFCDERLRPTFSDVVARRDAFDARFRSGAR